MNADNMLVLVTIDGVVFKVKPSDCVMSKVLWRFCNQNKDTRSSPKSITVCSSIFRKILYWLQNHTYAYTYLEGLKYEDLNEFDKKFLDVDDVTLINIFKEAHFLLIDQLVEICAIYLAHRLETKSVEEIRELFHEFDDFKPGEIEEIRKEAEQLKIAH
nr:SKP1 protein 1A [Hymenolepis microstoma]